MNDERIKQLSDIAYKNHLKNNPHSSFGRRTDYDREFAEKIVRECLGLCKDAENAFLLYGMQEREAHGAISVQEYIKEHFGVEL